MAQTYQYILTLTDKVSGSLGKITGTSSATIGKLESLFQKNKALQGSTKDLGSSISTLKSRIDLLQAEKELLPASALHQIGSYNKEIDKLTGKLGKLEGAGRGGALKRAFSQLDGLTGGMLSNPAALASAAVGGSIFGAMKFQENMAKVNVTAQLDEAGLRELSTKIKRITADNKADIGIAPVGFEQIISQVGEVDRSLEILDAVQKGAKGGFVQMDVAAGALAQTMSIVGEKANALEILDTFFASKRVGAGEFRDFAQYMPNLIAGGSNLGIAYKDVAGLFAYMTGKGQSAEKAAVLIENAFSVLGRGEVQQAMKKAGVQIFDNEGRMRSLVDVARDLNKVLSGGSDKQKSNILEGMGLRDKEAKNAFAVLTADVNKLDRVMNEVRDSSGETAKAVENSANPLQRASELWNSLKMQMVDIGETVMPVVNIGLNVAGKILSVMLPVLDGVVGLFTGWYDKLAEGNPLVWGLTAVVAAATLALNAQKIALWGVTAAGKAKALWDGIVTTATALWTGTQWGLNTALYACPIVWIIAAIGALVAGVVWAWNKFEGFRKAVLGVWECIKMLASIIADNLMGVIRNTLDGLGSLGQALVKLFSGDFKGAWESAKDGAQKLIAANPIVATVKTGFDLASADWSGAYQAGAQKGAESWAKSQQAKKAAQEQVTDTGAALEIPGVEEVATQASGNIDALLAKLGTGKGKGKGSGNGKKKDKDTFSLNGIQDLKGSTSYGAILSKLAPVRMAGLGAAAAASMAVAMPSGEATTLPAVSAPQTAMLDDSQSYASASKSLSLDRFCDQLVINIANADDKGYDQIKREVMESITNALDNYEA